MWSSEWFDRKREEGESEVQKNARDMAFAYNKRLQALDEPLRNFQIAQIEAEVFWSNKIAEPCKKLIGLISHLRVCIQCYLDSRAQGINDPTSSFAKVVFGQGENDEFKKGVDDSIIELETFLRNHIGTD
jgi:hypothetical protein